MNTGNKGRLSVVGIGPGDQDHITPAALRAIRNSEVIVGYTTYIDLIRGLIRDKEIITAGMTQEVQRCRKAIEAASRGRTVAVICSGDPGIYAMAGLVFELIEKGVQVEGGSSEQELAPQPGATEFDIEVIPGIPALSACASRLGAPLMHDFASISLSDRLTPWEKIESRLHAAAGADFVIVIYNPKSRGRKDHLERAIGIVAKYRKGDTPVGIVKAAMRKEEKIIITTLGSVPFEEVDMQSTVIIGNNRTYIRDGRIVTPRGYGDKYEL